MKYEYFYQTDVHEEMVNGRCEVVGDSGYRFFYEPSDEEEHEINNYRNMLKAQNTLNITEREYDYLTGVNYTDIIGECEKMGDYIINVEEAVSDRKAN